jgi:hypothetical protein
MRVIACWENEEQVFISPDFSACFFVSPLGTLLSPPVLLDVKRDDTDKRPVTHEQVPSP